MRRLKRAFMMFLLVVTIGVTPVFANFPVVDFTGLSNAISQFVTTVQHYASVIQDMRQTYERIKKAAESMAAGDFNGIMSGITEFISLTGDIGSSNQLFSDFMGSMGNTTQMIQQMGNMAIQSGQQLSNIWTSISSGNINNMDDAINTIFNAADGIGSTLMTGANVFSSINNVTNAMAATAMMGEMLGKDLEEVEAKIAALKEEIAEKQAELLKATENAGDAEGGTTIEIEQLAKSLDNLLYQLEQWEKRKEELIAQQEQAKKEEENQEEDQRAQYSILTERMIELAKQAEAARLAAEQNSTNEATVTVKGGSSSGSNTEIRI